MAKNKEEAVPAKGISPETQLAEFLDDNKEDHYNRGESPDYVVSSGSLMLDIDMAGGIHPSVFRMSGVTEGGKTSSALAFMLGFLKSVPNSRGCYIKSEGRLSEETKLRTGVPFTENAAEWKDGICFVFKTNVYETAISLIRKLIKENPTNRRYFFIIDSMDALVPKNDIDKEFIEANRTAGGALLSSDFLRKMAITFSSLGHICVMISQVRSTISINPYAKTDPKVTNASGGNAQLHYSDWILEFQQRWNKDIIWSGEEGKSERLGHFCKVIFRKSSNEKTGKEVRYPIKYGRRGGKSVWVEQEIIDVLLMFDLAKKTGAWYVMAESILDEIKKNKLEMPQQFQGMSAFRQYLEDTPAVTEFLFGYFRNMLSKLNEA